MMGDGCDGQVQNPQESVSHLISVLVSLNDGDELPLSLTLVFWPSGGSFTNHKHFQ